MKLLPPLLAVLLFTGALTTVFADDNAPVPQVNLVTGISGTYDTQSKFSTEEIAGGSYSSEHLDLHMLLEMNNNKEFGSDTIYLSTGNDLGNYFLVDRGDVVLKGMGFSLQAGRFIPEDEIDSPYSLVLNGYGKELGGKTWDSDTSLLVDSHITASNGMKLSYKLGPFTYSSEWISLNYQSNFGSIANTPPAWQWVWNGTTYVQTGTGFPDRGSDVHNFVYQTGSWRFGIQDQSIYSGRNFDSEYFFSPMPQYFTEYLRSIGGRPWTASNELDKFMMGFFVDWQEDDKDAYVQFQMADFNLHFLDPSLFPNNPAKFAWSIGGHVTNDWGRWGLFHAGATKYIYEAMTVSQGGETVRDVGDSYYPSMVYNLNGTLVPVDLESNQIGYTHGENNVALLATWDRGLANNKLHVGTSLEFILAGASSSANPWQGNVTTSVSDLGTQLLNDGLLEKRIQTELRADLAVEDWTFSVHVTLGEAFNVLGLQNPAGYVSNPNSSTYSVLTTQEQVWVPSDSNQTIFKFDLGVKYSYDASAWFKTN